MPRLALLVSVLAVAGCYEPNPNSCELAANMGRNGCPGDANNGGSCKADKDCTDSAFPACDLTVGTCFKCTADSHAACQNTTPRCEAHACVACIDDADCGTLGVCMPTGECAADSTIIHVTTGGALNGACGSTSMPCALETALNQAKSGKKVIKIDDNGTYIPTGGNFTVDVDQATPVTLDARGATLHRNDLNTPIITVNSGKGLVLLGGTIEGGAGNMAADGIRCATGLLGVYGATIRMNAGYAINSLGGCTVTIARSRLGPDNLNGGLNIQLGTFAIVGNIVLGNGGTLCQNSGVTINTGPSSGNRFDFNTVASNNTDSGITTAGVDCKAGAGFTANNNIIWGNVIKNGGTNAPQTANNCAYAYSNIGPLPVAGNMNSALDPNLTADGHLGNAALAQKADGNADLNGLAARDIDSDRRVKPADIGADQLAR